MDRFEFAPKEVGAAENNARDRNGNLAEEALLALPLLPGLSPER